MGWEIIQRTPDSLKSEGNGREDKTHGSKLFKLSKDFCIGFALKQSWKDQERELNIMKVGKLLAKHSANEQFRLPELHCML